ncbi:MAG: hypothetical protein EXS36_09995 [Pedosphaera sp.]|nr:hypothetical protein [Pedosphaera sp.]
MNNSQNPPVANGSTGLVASRLAASLVIGVVLCTLLAACWMVHAFRQKGASVRTESLVYSRWNSRNLPALMKVGLQNDGTTEWVVGFSLTSPGDELPIAIRFLFDVQRAGGEPVFAGRRDATTTLEEAVMETDAAGVTWRGSTAPVRLVDHSLVEFKCVAAQGVQRLPDRQQIQLRLRTRGSEQLALWCESKGVWKLFDMEPLGYAEMLTEPPKDPNSQVLQRYFPLGQWIFPLTEPAVSRWELLKSIWTLTDHPALLLRLLLWGGVLVVVGTSFLAWGLIQRDAPTSWFAVAGIGMLLTGLGWLHTGISPPFQPPDEPVHFISYAKHIGQTNLATAALTLAQRAHMERLRYRAFETFAAEHAHKPLTSGWAQSITTTEDMRSRSPIASSAWKLLGQFLDHESPAITLLELRAADSLIVGLAGAVSLALLAFARPVRELQVIVLGWLMIPALPFFGMHVSNYVWIIAFALAGSAAGSAALWTPSREPAVAVLFGVAIGGGLHVSRNAFPFVIWSVGLLALHTAAFRHDPSESNSTAKRQSALFWLALGVSCLSFGILGTREYEELLIRQLHFPAGVIRLIGGPGVMLGALMLLLAVAGFSWDSVVSRLALPTASPGREGVRRMSRWGSIFGIVVCGALVVMPLLFPQVELPTIEGWYPTPPTYAARALAALLTSFGVGSHDLYTVSSVVGGFGGPDTFLPAAAFSLFGIFVLGGFALLFVEGFRSHRNGIAGRAAWCVFCWMVAFVVVSVGCLALRFNIYGRYLISLYICLVGLAAPGWIFVWQRPADRAIVAAVALVIALSLHTYTFVYLLERYFG